jgi:hypothetical protein
MPFMGKVSQHSSLNDTAMLDGIDFGAYIAHRGFDEQGSAFSRLPSVRVVAPSVLWILSHQVTLLHVNFKNCSG